MTNAIAAPGTLQFWRNTDDADVIRFLKLFTELSMDEIQKLEQLTGAGINKAKVSPYLNPSMKSRLIWHVYICRCRPNNVAFCDWNDG